MRRVWQRHPVLVSALALAAGLTLFFAVRLIAFTIYWSDPAHRHLRVESWMTVGYVARSWSLPPREIDEAAGLPPPDGTPLTLREIAQRRGVPEAEVIRQVEDAVALLVARKALE